MPFTAQPGSENFYPGNIVPGYGGVIIDTPASDTISLTETASTVRIKFGSGEDTWSPTEEAKSPVIYTKSASETWGPSDSALGGLTLDGTTVDTWNPTESAKGIGNNRAVDNWFLTELAEGENPSNLLGEDTLSLTESAIKTLIPSHTVFEKISFTEGAIAQTKLTRQELEFINFTESADRGPGSQNVSGSDSIALTDATEGFIIRTGIDSISFTEDADNEVTKGVSDTLVFTDYADGVGRQVLIDTMLFTEKAAGNMIRVKMAHDNFVLADFTSGSHVYTVDAADTITFADEAVLSRYIRSASDTIPLNDQADTSPSYKRRVQEPLTFTESATNVRTYVRSASDTITFQETKFDPLEGIYVGDVIGLKPTTTFVLQTTSGSVTLPRPEFGDSENTTNEFNLRYARTGQVYTTIRRRRLNRRLVYTFNLSRRKERELVQVLSASNGKFMNIFNWKGEQWKVKLLSNPIQSNNIGFDRFRVELEFEGIQLTSGGVTSCHC